MTVTERAGYAVRMAATSLRGGDWIGYAPLVSDGCPTGAVSGPGRARRLLQLPRVLRASWRATAEPDV